MSESNHPVSNDPEIPPTTDTATAYAANQAWWNEITEPHRTSDMYDLAGFKAGRNRFMHRYILDEVGDVDGKSLLHLQCHFGQDTISWARLGATVTGVDFAGEAVDLARALAVEEGIDATFVHSNIYDIGDRFDEQFDVVFTSYGILGWLHDLPEWGRLAARALKPGGIFYIAEFHPGGEMIQYDRPIMSKEDLFFGEPYFDPGGALFLSGEEGTDYASDHSTGQDTWEWFHSMEDIIMALIDAGLVVELFRERDWCAYRSHEGMIVDDQGRWHLPPDCPKVPFMFSIRARKPV
ncbi:MAG: class I SAM-dependent methyltransferase [Chloroflexi bacterium]|nr:class I SAM-dependent methyltransferase [Chloroflexota bacterium]